MLVRDLISALAELPPGREVWMMGDGEGNYCNPLSGVWAYDADDATSMTEGYADKPIVVIWPDG